jgi:SAM-dependent methyltransferase
MSSPVLSRYEQVAYTGFVYPQAHPGRLAVIASLFEMEPAPPEHCRVLELGCGDGANLIPTAYELPQSQFIGLDLSPAAVQRGQELVTEIGLRNVALAAGDILSFPADAGQFDYIVAHGVYSWVPAPVRQKLLAICETHLAPQGVAYVSYNAKPGNHVRRMVDEMMRFHARGMSNPEEQVAQARALLKLLAEAGAQTDIYRDLLHHELEQIAKRDDAALYHDGLEDYAAFYLTEFLEQAGEHGLAYLGDADFFEMTDEMFSPQMRTAMNTVPNRALRDQYLDFAKCRRFCQTLLCRSGVRLDDAPRPDAVRNFWCSAHVRASSEQPSLASEKPEQFIGEKDGRVTANHPITKAALHHLGNVWPRALHFNDLYSAACQLLIRSAQDAAAEPDAAVLAQSLVGCYAAGIVAFQPHEPKFCLSPGERPTASPVARAQAQRSTCVSNLAHGNARLEDELVRRLILLLDGTRDRQALLRDFRLEVAAAGRPIDGITEERLDAALQRAADMALLVS